MTPGEILAAIEIGSSCWQWTRALTAGGYAKSTVDGQAILVHRWMYEHFVGPIPEGLELDHLCRVRSCVRPSHLEAVTHRTNTLRGNTIPAARAAQTHCMQGHPYDEENTYIWAKDGTRRCRACARFYNRRRKAA